MPTRSKIQFNFKGITMIYEAAIKAKNVQELLQHLDGSEYLDGVSTEESEQALAFLKAHEHDNQFEKELAKSAVKKALDFLTYHEEMIKSKLDEVRAKEAKRQVTEEKASAEAKKVFSKKIEPAFTIVLDELQKLRSIPGYKTYSVRSDVDVFIRNITAAIR